jgi:preprotein translocase subunit SecG
MEVLLVVHLIIALALIGVVLMQRSEGGALGIGGSSSGGGNLFSARGVGNALTRTTAYLALGFFITSIALTLIATRGGTGGSAFDGAGGTSAPTQQQTPAEEGAGGSVLPQLPGTPQVPVSQ